VKPYGKQLTVIGLLLMLLVACVLGESVVQRHRAEDLLQLLADVDVGTAPNPALFAALGKFKGYRSSEGSQSGRSYDQFVFRNRGFALLALAPAKVLYIQIDFRNGIVIEKSIHFAEAPNRGAMIMEEAEIDSERIDRDQVRPPVPRQVEERGAATESTYVLSVRDSIEVPKMRRQMDWALDVSCLTRLGSCGDFRRVLRGAFE
jgi:hypothetical protein